MKNHVLGSKYIQSGILMGAHVFLLDMHQPHNLLNRQDQVPAVISPRFQQTLVNSLAQSDRLLHTAARKVVVRMTAFAQSASSPALRVSLALALQRHGTGNFDRLTRTKTVFHLLQVQSTYVHCYNAARITFGIPSHYSGNRLNLPKRPSTRTASTTPIH